MTENKLEKWIMEELIKGVEVNMLFPNAYDEINGFGYEIPFKKQNENFIVVLVRKESDQPKFRIHKVCKVHWDKDTDEKIQCNELIGKYVLLAPKEPKRFGPYVSRITITGTLRLQNCGAP